MKICSRLGAHLSGELIRENKKQIMESAKSLVFSKGLTPNAVEVMSSSSLSLITGFNLIGKMFRMFIRCVYVKGFVNVKGFSNTSDIS